MFPQKQVSRGSPKSILKWELYVQAVFQEPDKPVNLTVTNLCVTLEYPTSIPWKENLLVFSKS